MVSGKETKIRLFFIFVMILGVHSICDYSQHECDNGNKCILSEWVCDGEYDCLDKSDEVDCDQECNHEEFACASSPHTCLPRDWLCDGESDCDDKSDEANCSSIVCAAGYFSCGENSTCIPNSLMCDGHPDCPTGRDENAATCSNKTACHDDEFQCVTDKSCISKRWVCDNDNDCLDRSDEVGCSLTTTCAPSDWRCNDSQCIPSKWHCDGSFDCHDHSDESGCPVSPEDLSSKHCSENEFFCKRNHECIHKTWVCDGTADCEDGTDEDRDLCGVVTCLPNHFQCNTSGNCIPALLKCDGVRHCDDGSDESDSVCSEDSNVRACDPLTEFDCSGGYSDHCVPLDAVCDGKRDCFGGEDENRTHCLSNQDSNVTNGCEKSNGGCSHDCIPTRRGYYCSCPEGFYLAENNKLCEDIDECLEPDTCSQVCHNRPGGYKCSCHTGYELDSFDHITCRAKGGEPMMIFSNEHDLRQIHLYTGRYRPMLEDVNSAVAVDYDVEDRTLFWSDVTSENISRVTFDERGSLLHMETIVSDDVRVPDGLAYDWVHKNLYWTDTGNDRIEVLSLKSARWRRTLINTDLDEPRAIIVDPREKHRMMYWTDWGESPKIERAFLDGSSRQTLISTGIEWPNGLTIDYETDRLFWVDAKLHIIASSDLDGGQRRVILTSYSFLMHPFAVAVFEDDVYWTDWHTQSILKTSKLHSRPNNEVVHVANDLTKPMDLHIYHGLKQPAGEDICHNKCSHVCLPRPGNPGFTCLCPPDNSEFKHVLDRNDRQTCIRIKIDAAVTGGAKIPGGNGVTTTPKSMMLPKVDKSEEPVKQNQQKLVAVVVSVIVTVVFLVILIVAGCFILKMHRRKNIKTMNFDNPVYRKTTEEQFCLDKSLQHSTRQVPVLLEPLTAPIHETV